VSDLVMSCDEVLEHVLAFVDREMGESDRLRLERHLETCRNCYSRVEFERRLKGRLTALAREEAPALLRDRVSRLIERF
jgi:anti-sigma factor (TIGR02949 family)